MALLHAHSAFNTETAFAYQDFTSLPYDVAYSGNTVTQASLDLADGTSITVTGAVTGDINAGLSGLSGYLDGFYRDLASGADYYDITGGQVNWQSYINTQNGLWLASNTFAGADTMLGSNQADYIFGFDGNDTIAGGGAVTAPDDAADLLVGSRGNDVIYGNAGNDSIYGDGATLASTDGHDTLYGGLGDDEIYGGGGNDQLIGGSGSDGFYFGGGYDLIIDFETGIDQIVIASGLNGITDFAGIVSHMVYDSNGVFINLGAGNGITLAGDIHAQLSAGDFIFA